MNKVILFDKEAREKVRRGVNVIADAVSVTLGASGRNVLISRSEVVDYGTASLPIKVTKDGVTVARGVQLTDLVENVGVMMMREASEKTMTQAGDGTTTTIVLGRGFVNEGIKLIEAGANPMELKDSIDKAVDYAINNLKSIASSVGDDVDTIRKIATVSANNDSAIGDLVATAFEKIGKDGIINIEPAKSVNTEIKIIDGFELNTGYISPYFITDRAKGTCELIEPNILLYEKSLFEIRKIERVLESSIKTGRPLLIVCEDANGDALSTLIMNHVQNRIPPVCIVRCPMFMQNKQEVMEDIAVCTGATYLTDSKGVGIENATIDQLGQAKKVVVTRDSAVIIGGYKDENAHKSLLDDLQISKFSTLKDDDEKISIEKRIARLKGGIAVIYVGGPTETEMKERVDRVDDAVRAAKSASEEGYVAGGGVVFLRLLNKLTPSEWEKNENGYKILTAVLEHPIRQMLYNAGYNSNKESAEEMRRIVHQVRSEMSNVGFNAKTGVVEDLMEAGIIDPVKVLRCSLQNAASVAGMILTSQCIICDTLN